VTGKEIGFVDKVKKRKKVSFTHTPGIVRVFVRYKYSILGHPVASWILTSMVTENELRQRNVILLESAI
jgi:hypothetical protein